MHLKGKIELRQAASATPRGAIDLEYSDAVTVLDTAQSRVVYDGVVFSATDAEIASNPQVLDAAFGYYTYVAVDKQTGRISIGTDRLGFSPLYYSLTDRALRFATSMALLKGGLERLTPNMDAWDEILTLGDIIGEKTVVKEIQRLQWGRKISILDGKVEFVSVWDPETPQFCDPKVYVERNNELLLEAVRLTAGVKRERIVALTGGQDSRRIAAMMRRAGIDMACATQEIIGKDNKDDDVLIAQEVARALGVRHLRIDVPAPQVFRSDGSLKDYWSGYESGYHAWAVNFTRCLPRGSLIYDGIVGDVSINGHYFRAYPDAIDRYDDIDYLARRLCGEEKSSVAPRLLTAPLVERVRAELARLPASPHRLTYFFILNHTRRNIGAWYTALGLFRHVPSTPYLYYPYFLQSLSLSPKAYLGSWMQNECLQAQNPQLAQIPSTRDPIPARYLKDMSALASDHELQDAMPMAVRKDVKRYLPGFTTRYLARSISSQLGLSKLGERWRWVSARVERFSEFLDWVEDRDEPSLPAREDVPFIVRRSVVAGFRARH